MEELRSAGEVIGIEVTKGDNIYGVFRFSFLNSARRDSARVDPAIDAALGLRRCIVKDELAPARSR